MFRKNTAGQFVHFQGVDASTGGAKSGVSWTVRRCIDGSFAAATGTVSEDSSNGWYSFAMSQADTNGNNIGFNFTGSGAVPQTVNIVTTSANPYDAVRFGLTALPNANADAAGGLPISDAGGLDLDAQRADVAAILVDTGTTLDTKIDTIDGVVDAILVDTSEIGVAGAGLTAIDLPDQTMNITGNITGNLSGSVGSVTGAVGSVTGSVGSIAAGGIAAASFAAGAIDASAIAANAIGASELAADATAEIADRVLGRNVAGGSDGTRTVSEALYVLRNKTDIAAGTLTVYQTDDATPAFTAAVTTTAGNPISQIDPA
jgi:hypothetical protein